MTPSPGLYARIEAASAALDQLLSDVALGVRSPAQFDALEERATAIGAQLRQAFRERTSR